MNRIYYSLLSIFVFTFFLSSSPLHAQSVIYVDSSAVTGFKDGSTWANAYSDLSLALSKAPSGSQIWIANGTYFPTSTTNQSVSISIDKPLEIYGGFSGNETNLNQRNPELNLTFLSADIGVKGVRDDNSGYILNIQNVSKLIIIDGISFGDSKSSPLNIYKGNCQINNCKFYRNTNYGIMISNGIYTISNSLFKDNTYGISCTSSTYTITDCDFNHNELGVYDDRGNGKILNCSMTENTTVYNACIGMFLTVSLVIDNCKFINNAATTHSCVISAVNPLNLVVKNSDFINNRTGTHSVIKLQEANATFENCKFRGNYAGNFGGTMYISSNSNVIIKNSDFINNRSGETYPGLKIENSTCDIRNCTFISNTSPIITGALGNQTRSTSIVTNSIFRENGPKQIENYGFLTIKNSIIQGGYVGSNNFDSDPLFLDKDGPDDILGNLDDNLQIANCSPAVNRGTIDTSGLYLPPNDLSGLSRIFNDTVDIGAYESQGWPSIVNSFQGSANFCQGDSVIINAPAGYSSYEWSNNATTPSINVKQAGSYKVRVRDNNNCPSPYSDPVIVMVNPLPSKPSIVNVGSDILEADLSAPIYEWKKGTEVLNDFTKQINATSGKYTVRLQDYNSCYSIPSDTFEFVLTSTVDPLTTNGFILYPNPTRGLITVNMEEAFGMSDIKVMNSIGQVCQAKINWLSSKKAIVDVSDFENSLIYILVTLKNKVATYPVIISKE